MHDLELIIQGPNEMIQSYIRRFSEATHGIKNAKEADIINAFWRNLTDERMHEELSIREPDTLSELYELAEKCTRMEEGRLGAKIIKKEALQLEA